MTVSDLLEQPWNKSDNIKKIVISAQCQHDLLTDFLHDVFTRIYHIQEHVLHLQKSQHFLSFQTGRPKSVCENWRLESFRSSFTSTYVPSCRENGSFAKTQCHFEVTRIRCWEVDKYGKPTGKKRPDIILPPRSRYNTEHDSTRTLQPITNDASARMFGYTRTGSTTENEIVERNQKTTKTRQPMSKVLLKQVSVSLRT
jgi:hypothetical protein